MRRLAGACLAAALALGCGGPPPPAPRPAPAPPPLLHDGPLTDYVPAAGLRWLVVGRPRELASDPGLSQALDLLVPAERRDAYWKASGVDLARLEAGLIAGFDHATLYVADARDRSTTAEERFAERLVAGARVAQPHPRIRRLAGVVGRTPETMVRIDDRLIAVSVGSGLPARIVELYALSKLKKSPTALRGSALSSLPVSELEAAPLRFYAPGPFAGEWATGARGLLSAASAVGVAVRPAGDGKLSVVAVVAGAFGSASDPATSAEQAWGDLAQSSLGKLLGLDQAAPPSVVASPDAVRVSVEVAALPLAHGLKAAVAAEVWEILDLRRPAPDKAHPP